jgi:non-specific serine/threonine protein kinase
MSSAAESGPPVTASRGLPLYLTNFVGRERDVDACLIALADSRLVTVIGPGGAGKTRLGIEAARRWTDTHAPDTWFVGLAALTDQDLVWDAVGQALGITVDATADVKMAVETFLAQGEGLLMLDNCEHVVAGVAELGWRLLDRCPDIRILATSREPVGVAGERRILLSGMTHASGATSLFFERARVVDADFAVTDENIALIARTCELVDGLPLGIELAAAMVRVMPLQQIAERLEQAVPLLPTTNRKAPQRQRSLSETVRWSYDLLPAPERDLLGRLAVFAGGWTLEAAESVCADGGMAALDVLPGLASLVDRSMVISDTASRRFRLLEPVWEFARELGTYQRLQWRHASWFADWLDNVGPQLETRHAAQARAAIERELRNLRFALAWSVESDDGFVLGARIFDHLATYWERSGHHAEAVAWGQRFLAAAQLHGNAAITARVAIAALGIHSWRPAAEDMERLAEIQAVVPAMDHPDIAAEMRLVRAAIDAHQGRHDVAIPELLEVLAYYREKQDARHICQCLRALATAHLWTGDGNAMDAATAEALEIVREHGDGWMEHFLLTERGRSFMERRNIEAAEADFRRSLDVFGDWEGNTAASFAWMHLGVIGNLTGQFESAAADLRKATVLAHQGGDRTFLAFALASYGIAIAFLGDPRLGTTIWAWGVSSHGVSEDTPGVARLRTASARALKTLIPEDEFGAAVAKANDLSSTEAVEWALGFEVPSSHEAGSNRPAPAGLTLRETEVLRLHADGRTNRQIAVELTLTVSKVEALIASIYRKLGVNGRGGAIEWAQRQRVGPRHRRSSGQRRDRDPHVQ